MRVMDPTEGISPMLNLTADQIAAAQANDINALSAVIAETEERVGQLARRYATSGGRTDESLREDLVQVGRIAVWEGLSRFEGDSVAQFFTFMDRTVSGKLAAERRVTSRQGVSEGTAARFEKALSLAGGDAYEAERIAQTDAMSGDRLSADMAYAARLSWQGVEFLDAQVPRVDGSYTLEPHSPRTLMDRVANSATVEDAADFSPTKRSRPITWVLVSRALEAHVKVPVDAAQRKTLMSALHNISIGIIRADQVDALEDFVTVPRDVVAAKELSAAFNMLHGFLADEDSEEVPEEDPAAVRTRRTRQAVRAALAKMGAKGANVLRGTFGINPAPMTFGADNEDLLADWVGIKRSLVRQTRAKAKAAFARIYLAGAGA